MGRRPLAEVMLCSPLAQLVQQLRLAADLDGPEPLFQPQYLPARQLGAEKEPQNGDLFRVRVWGLGLRGPRAKRN